MCTVTTFCVRSHRTSRSPPPHRLHFLIAPNNASSTGGSGGGGPNWSAGRPSQVQWKWTQLALARRLADRIVKWPSVVWPLIVSPDGEVRAGSSYNFPHLVPLLEFATVAGCICGTCDCTLRAVWRLRLLRPAPNSRLRCGNHSLYRGACHVAIASMREICVFKCATKKALGWRRLQ